MKNGYDHHEHHDIYTYNLSVSKKSTLDVPAKSPPYLRKDLEVNEMMDIQGRKTNLRKFKEG